ncbi:hypothetical protein D3C72_2093660 [compost metagenome]
MADAGARHHVQHAVQKTVACAQDGHQGQLLAVDHFADHLLHGRLDFQVLQRKVACDLIGHQRRQLAQHAAKAVGAGFLAAHQGQFVLNQGVVDDGDFGDVGGHGCFCFSG